MGRRWCSCDSARRLVGSLLNSCPPQYQVSMSVSCAMEQKPQWHGSVEFMMGYAHELSASVTERHFLLGVCEELSIHLSDFFVVIVSEPVLSDHRGAASVNHSTCC